MRYFLPCVTKLPKNDPSHILFYNTSLKIVENLLVYFFGGLIGLTYFAVGSQQHMSYVAERRGGGPHDLLGGFDSFRNCKGPVLKMYDCFYGNNG